MGLQQSQRLYFHTVLCDLGPPAREANQVGGIVAGDMLKEAPYVRGRDRQAPRRKSDDVVRLISGRAAMQVEMA